MSTVKNKLSIPFAYALLVTALTGCEQLDKKFPDPPGDDDDGMVRNLPARDFYQPFLYDLHTKEKALVSELANNAAIGSDSAPALADDRHPGVSLFLITDGTYYLEYTEGRAGGYGGLTVFESVLFNGAWDIVEGRITLGNQATLALNPAAGTGLEITFSANIVSAGLARQPFNLSALSAEDQGDDLLDVVLKKHGHRPIPPPDATF